MKVNLTHEICRAPVIEGAIPPVEEVLLQLVEHNQNKFAALFALGNLRLRGGRIQEAASAYRQALAEMPDSAEVRCNLALACELLHDEQEPLIQLKQAVLLKPDLILAQFHLARLQLRSGDISGAEAMIERLLRQKHAPARSHLLYAYLLEAKGDEDKAAESFRRAWELEPESDEAAQETARHLFEAGRQFFADGDLEQAVACWADAHENMPDAFFGDQGIRTGLRECRKQFEKEGCLEAYRRAWREKKAEDSRAPYVLFLHYYFSLGLQPALFAPWSLLDQEENRWAQSPADVVQLEFHRFRLAVIHTYQGKLRQALEELTICEDRFPASKKEPWKVGQIASFLRELLDEDRAAGGDLIGDYSREQWEACGFADAFQQQAWSKAGASPEQAVEWKSLRFSPGQFRNWQMHGFSSAEAQGWLQSGIEDANEAAVWRRGDFSPAQAVSWRPHFPGQIERAVQSKKAGFADAELAARFLKVFTFPWEAVRWHEQGFDAKDAALWLAKGVHDPFVAKQQEKAENVLQAVEASSEAPGETEEGE